MKKRIPNALLFVRSAILLIGFLSATRSTASVSDSKKELSNYGIDFWREAEGLPQSRIREIVQTRDGYLWMGTDGGLLRFDGVTFTSFTVQTGDLKENEVWTLKEDNEGGLWIGTFGGGLTLFKDGRSTTFTTSTTGNGLADDAIRQVDLDPDGDIWIATARGLSRYSHGAFTSFTVKDGLVHNFVIAVCASCRDGIFAIAGNMLHRYRDGKFVIENGVVEKGDGALASLASGGDGSLWIYFESGVAKKLRNGMLTSYRVENPASSRGGRIYEDPQGTVWLGSRDGLRKLNNGKFELVSLGDARNDLGAVYCMFADREKSLWLGLESNGLARLRRTRFATLGTEDGLPDNGTRTVFQNRQGDIWIGTMTAIAKYSNGSITSFTTLDGSPIPPVIAIAEDKEGTLWIGARGELYKMKNGKLARDPNWKRVPDIKSIYRDPQGRMWIGTDGDGLFRFDNGGVTVYRVEDGLASNYVRSILYDRSGALWVATSGGGVSRLVDGKFTTYTVEHGLGSNRLVAIYEDQEGSLWFATRGGLSRFKGGHFFTYRVENGLFANYVSGILEDGKGNFWFSCGQGIFRVSKADLSDFADGKIKAVASHAYGVRDGMNTTAFGAGNQPNAWRTADGRLLFCSLKGLVVVDPEKVYSNEVLPPVRIEKVQIDKHDQRIDQHADIPPGRGEGEIRYTALSYLVPEKVRFRYQLIGFDEEWVDAGTRRFAYYGSLPAGEYQFRVIACNDSGKWNEAGASFSFYLQPIFYKTFWFYALISLAMILLVAGIYVLRVRQLNVHKRELQKRVDEAIAKIKVLSGMLPICANCKKVRDDKGYWSQIESYITQHSDTEITHGICPDCMSKLYPEFCEGVLGAESVSVAMLDQKSS
jgi:ligand-binding sensor domain-containing protein